jgi:protease II
MNIQGIPAPKAPIKPYPMTIHEDTRVDNYYWLNDRENPEVITYLEAENAYTETVMSPTKAFQEELFEEMKGRIKEQDESVPYRDGEYYYYSKYIEGGEYPLYCRKNIRWTRMRKCYWMVMPLQKVMTISRLVAMIFRTMTKYWRIALTQSAVVTIRFILKIFKQANYTLKQ